MLLVSMVSMVSMPHQRNAKAVHEIHENSIWLVVSTPLENILVSWDDYSQYIWKNTKCSKPPTSHVLHQIVPVLLHFLEHSPSMFFAAAPAKAGAHPSWMSRISVMQRWSGSLATFTKGLFQKRDRYSAVKRVFGPEMTWNLTWNLTAETSPTVPPNPVPHAWIAEL